jgi:hypothetical protein
MFAPVSGFPVEINATTGTLTINENESVIVVLIDLAAANSTLTLSDGTNTYVTRGTKSDTRSGVTTTLVDCLSPTPGTYTFTLSGASEGQMNISKYTGLSAFSAGSFASALFTSRSTTTPPTTTDGITTAAITPTAFPAMIFGAALTVPGDATLVLSPGTGFTSRFISDVEGIPGVFIEDLSLPSGSNIASFTAVAPSDNADLTVIGAAYIGTVSAAPQVSSLRFMGIGPG